MDMLQETQWSYKCRNWKPASGYATTSNFVPSQVAVWNLESFLDQKNWLDFWKIVSVLVPHIESLTRNVWRFTRILH